MHDYNIEWDYILDEYVDTKDLKLLFNSIKDIKKNYLHKLNACKDFFVYPIILADGLLGVYCLGTCEQAVIGIDIGNLKIACEEYNTDFELVIKTTILHELKHSEQEYNDKPLDEIEAEDFAFDNA